MLKRNFLIVMILMIAVAVFCQNPDREKHNYIKKYKDIAIREMERSGVPASIKLAQGILESNAGKSTLARKANNHFGIKCGSRWSGRTYYKEDDDYDEEGRLIKSCFRVFPSAKECYVAHSEFLRDPRKRYRYGFLFDLDPRDYRAWSKGLKKAGYATSPTYADKLIRIIEYYKLYQYDTMEPGTPSNPTDLSLSGIQMVNGAKTVLAKNGDTPALMGAKYKVSPQRIVNYNERIENTYAKLKEGTRVFLQKKRKSYRGKEKWHRMEKGETMYSISQRYGVRLSKLYSRNRMPEGSEPAIGEKIKLRGWFRVAESQKPRLSTQPKEKSDEELEFIDDDGNVVTEDIEDKPGATGSGGIMDPMSGSSNAKYHIVKEKETLYSISRKYDISIDKLKSLNRLDSNFIKKGQRLRIK